MLDLPALGEWPGLEGLDFCEDMRRLSGVAIFGAEGYVARGWDDLVMEGINDGYLLFICPRDLDASYATHLRLHQ